MDLTGLTDHEFATLARVREAIAYDQVGDGTPVVKRNPDGSLTHGTIELHLNGVYGIDTGSGVTDLATGDELDLLRESITRLREGTYGGEGTPQVYFEDDDTYRDVADLYELLPSQRDDGTANLENGQVEQLARTMLGGHPLSDMEIGLLKRLLAKYSAQLEKIRANPNRLDGRDYLDAPDPATARLGG